MKPLMLNGVVGYLLLETELDEAEELEVHVGLDELAADVGVADGGEGGLELLDERDEELEVVVLVDQAVEEEVLRLLGQGQLELDHVLDQVHLVGPSG